MSHSEAVSKMPCRVVLNTGGVMTPWRGGMIDVRCRRRLLAERSFGEALGLVGYARVSAGDAALRLEENLAFGKALSRSADDLNDGA